MTLFSALPTPGKEERGPGSQPASLLHLPLLHPQKMLTRPSPKVSVTASFRHFHIGHSVLLKSLIGARHCASRVRSKSTSPKEACLCCILSCLCSPHHSHHHSFLASVCTRHCHGSGLVFETTVSTAGLGGVLSLTKSPRSFELVFCLCVSCGITRGEVPCEATEL